MTARLTLAPLAAALLSAAPAYAQDVLYKLDPTSWTLYSVTRSPPGVIAPNLTTVTPFLVGTSRGTVGPPGYTRTGPYQTGYHLHPNGIDEFYTYYEYLSGASGAHQCIDGNITGYSVHQCLDFDGQTGAFNSASPAIVAYSITPTADENWWRVSITFKTAAVFVAGNQAFPYFQANPGQRFALWGGQLIEGQAP
jgi:hypothetical protein